MKKLTAILLVAMASVAMTGRAQSAPDTVSVTINFDCTDADGVSATPGNTLLEQGLGTYYKLSYSSSNPSPTVQVPAGCYDLFTQFKFGTAAEVKKDAYCAIVVKERLQLTSDTTITVSLKDAKHLLRFEHMLPTGELYHNTTTETTTKTATETRNASSIGRLSLVHKDMGCYMTDAIVNFGITETTNGVVTRKGSINVLASDMSKDYELTEFGYFVLEGDSSYSSVCIMQGVVGCDSSMTITNPNDFTEISDNFRISPNGETSAYTGGGCNGFNTYTRGTDVLSLGEGGSHGYVARTDSSTVCRRRALLCDQLTGLEGSFAGSGVILKHIDWAKIAKYSRTYYLNRSPNYELKNGRVWAAVSGTTKFVGTKIDGKYVEDMAGHPEFSYYQDQRADSVLCNNVPVISVATTVSSKTQKPSGLYSVFVGRYGEKRGADAPVARVTVASGDTTVYSGALGESFTKGFKSLTTAGLDAAKVTFVITDANVWVDDQPASNTTTISMDLGADDYTAPTLQMLQLRDTETGLVTDRFAENAPEAELRIAGGDFAYDLSTSLYSYQHECKIDVSYSPAGLNEWKPLEVKAEPANRREVAFGDFWRGTLDQVTEQSANKWYDLQVTLTDPAGNSQTQVLAPAFRIEQIVTTSVATVPAARQVASVAYYDLAGRVSRVPFDGVNVVRTTYTDGTTATAKVMR